MTDQNPLGHTGPLSDLVLRKLPVRPTTEMIAAAEDLTDSSGRLRCGADLVWRTMAAAWPDQPRAHRPVEQAAAGYLIQWRIDTDRKRIQLTDEVEPWLARLNPTITPLGPLAASPPSRALSQDEREAWKPISEHDNTADEVLVMADGWTKPIVAWRHHPSSRTDMWLTVPGKYQVKPSLFRSLPKPQPEGEANG